MGGSGGKSLKRKRKSATLGLDWLLKVKVVWLSLYHVERFPVDVRNLQASCVCL